MSKKLFTLVWLVFVLVMVGSASAQEAQVMVWTDGTGDHLWCNPDNWADGFLPTVWDYNYFDLGDSVDIDIPSMSHPVVIGSGCEAQASWVHVGLNNNVGVGLEVTGGYFHGFEIIMGSEEGSSGTMIMSGGVVELDNYSYFSVGDGGNGTFIMTGGELYADGTIWNGNETTWAGTVNIPKNEKGDGTGHLQLDGGTIVTRRFEMRERGTMDITGGKMIITGNIYGSDLKAVNDYIDAGVLTAYGGSGLVGIIYDESDPNAVLVLLGRVDAESAWNPEPADKAVDIDRDAVISWQPGDYAGTHKVYFGTDLAAVSNRDGSVYKGPQPLSSTTYDAGTEEDLQLAETYYWAIDEVNGTQTWPGQVWRFTIDLGIAENPGPSNGAKNILRDVVLSWSPGVDAASVAGHDIYFGADFEDVNTADTSSSDIYIWRQDALSYNLGETTDLELATTYYWRIDEVNDANVWQGEVWRFMTNDGTASNPNPAHWSRMVPLDVVLSWSPGLDVTSVAGHDVYFGTSFDDVNDADNTLPPGESVYKGRQDLCSYDAGIEEDLRLATDYYWRIDEVNDANLWRGHIWRFTAADYHLLDDFERYAKTDILRDVWNDGFVTGISGSEVTRETYIVRDKKSMKFDYANWSDCDYFSEVVAETFPGSGSPGDYLLYGPDWQANRAESLALWFYGKKDNSFDDQEDTIAYDKMYVALEDGDEDYAEVLYYGDMNDIRLERWQEWNIGLDEFTDDNPDLDLSSIKKIYVGFGIEDGGVEGDDGSVWFDDVRLYPRRCVPKKAYVTGSFGDLRADCVTDYNDLDAMGRDWLMEGYDVVPTEPTVDPNRWYMLDDGSGTIAADDGNDAAPGTLADEPNDPEWDSETTPDSNCSLDFDGGSDDGGDYVTIPTGWHTGTNNLTITAWVKGDAGESVDVLQTGGAGIVWARDSITNNGTGLCYGMTESWVGNNEVMYCWDELYWEWHSELFIPESQWTFVAAVVEPTQATVYMKPLDGTFSYATHAAPHHIIADTGDFLSKLGDDLNGDNMDGTCFEGRMSDVRIYRRALSPGEIAYLAGMTYGDDPVERYFKTLDKWRADADRDGTVNMADFAIMADYWLEEILFPIP